MKQRSSPARKLKWLVAFKRRGRLIWAKLKTSLYADLCTCMSFVCASCACDTRLDCALLGLHSYQSRGRHHQTTGCRRHLSRVVAKLEETSGTRSFGVDSTPSSSFKTSGQGSYPSAYSSTGVTVCLRCTTSNIYVYYE